MQDGIDEQDEKEEQEDGRAGRKICGHGRAAHDEDAVRLADGDDEAQERADSYGTERDSRSLRLGIALDQRAFSDGCHASVSDRRERMGA